MVGVIKSYRNGILARVERLAVLYERVAAACGQFAQRVIARGKRHAVIAHIYNYIERTARICKTLHCRVGHVAEQRYLYGGAQARKRALVNGEISVRRTVAGSGERRHYRLAVYFYARYGETFVAPGIGMHLQTDKPRSGHEVCRHGRARQALNGVVYRPQRAVKRYGRVAVILTCGSAVIASALHDKQVAVLNIVAILRNIAAAVVIYENAESGRAVPAYLGSKVVDKSVKVDYLIILLIVEVRQNGYIRRFAAACSA